jgi:hypothetical protein
MRGLGHCILIVGLTLLTQAGGIAWLAALRFQHRLMAFAMFYALLLALTNLTAPAFGRVPLPCTGAPLRMQSVLYCVTMRNFVTPEMAAVARDAAAKVAVAHPGSVTLALDGGFPFLDGMPLLPHLSHDDGAKLDFAYAYTDGAGRYLPGQTRSPIGYWAFERAAPAACPPVLLTARWGMAWLQPLWPDRPLDPVRTTALIRALLADPRVGKVFVEPPLAARLGLSDEKLRFQGCRAARHDDHIHAQL